ncbi:hypothetical protein [Rhizobium sp. RU20A]|uniref:hypothetical protein n=1 Tax=Rhizobium sp. RU20A TaxID=1907412 RepID=UPI001FCE403D|nr:hypothetical protein [Rhizobium sp. RU20A]
MRELVIPFGTAAMSLFITTTRQETPFTSWPFGISGKPVIEKELDRLSRGHRLQERLPKASKIKQSYLRIFLLRLHVFSSNKNAGRFII